MPRSNDQLRSCCVIVGKAEGLVCLVSSCVQTRNATSGSGAIVLGRRRVSSAISLAMPQRCRPTLTQQNGIWTSLGLSSAELLSSSCRLALRCWRQASFKPKTWRIFSSRTWWTHQLPQFASGSWGTALRTAQIVQVMLNTFIELLSMLNVGNALLNMPRASIRTLSIFVSSDAHAPCF